VLVLGGGDGLALRELLRFQGVGQVELVDLDPAVTGLFQRNPLLTGLNQEALSDPRVRVINQDAWKFLEHSAQLYDLILIDLPDPRNLSLSRLYSRSFYRLAARRLAADGLLATQATSPLYAREAFWSIHDSIASELHTLAYHAYVPSFGDWGFVLAAHRPIDWARAQPLPGARFVTAETLAAMPQFPPDSARVAVRPNTLMEHALVGYYRQGWGKWYD
jgi:spermidine synthase